MARIAQDTPVSQCTRTEFHPTSEPTHYLSFGQPGRNECCQLREIILFVNGIHLPVQSLHIYLRVGGTEVCAHHAVVGCRKSTFLVEIDMAGCQRSAQRTACIACSGLDI